MSLRRQVRLRKEYLYRKSLEGKDKATYERKRLLRAALQEGKSIPTELRGDEDKLRHEIELEDAGTAVPQSHVDDEYALAGTRDPKICITTSRDPSSRLKQFMKELKLIFPNSQSVNRGNTKINELVEVELSKDGLCERLFSIDQACRSHDFTDIVMVQETRGQPDALVVCHLPFGPTAYFTMSDVVMRHDIENRGTISEAFPHIILNGLETQLGQRVGDILRYLFPVPKPDSKRVVTFSNEDDRIVFRHHVYEKAGKEINLKEVGPRFDLKLYQVKLGTIEQADAETEYVLRPYMNTAKKRKML